eukprot:jgi/Psemu1/327863/estExt_fgenesh1_pg.C_8610002
MNSLAPLLAFLLLVATGYDNICAAADDVNTMLTFINFSEQTIEVDWVNTESPDGERFPAAEVHPYESTTTQTFAGHEFVYQWGDALARYKVETDSDQVHILGDAPNMAMDESENQDANANKQNRRTIESKSVVCGTTEGDIRITIKPRWSPIGAARFLDLVSDEVRYFDWCALNRVVPQFLTQFGIGSSYEQRSTYNERTIPDDPVPEPPISFKPGYMSYAGSGPNSRTTEVFVVMPDTPQSQLEYFGENPWETPFGYVDPEDLEVVAKWYSYGDMAPWGNGPDPQRMYRPNGYEYLQTKFPNLSYVLGCIILRDGDLDEDGKPFPGTSYDQLMLQHGLKAEL